MGYSELNRLTSLLAAIPPIAQTDLSDVLNPISHWGAQLDRVECRVTLFGAAKTGKSSVLNGLIGAPLLAARAFRTNRAVTEVRYGPIPQVSIERSPGVEESVDFDQVRRLTGNVESPSDPTAQEIRVSVPLPLLSQGMVLVDTPGLLTDAGLDGAARDQIMHADLAVMVLAADKILSAEERAAAAWVNSLLRGNVVFIVNRMDLIDDEDRTDVLEWTRVALHDTGNDIAGKPRIFSTSVPPGARSDVLVHSDLHVWLQTLNSSGESTAEQGADSSRETEHASSQLRQRVCRQSRLGVLEQQMAAVAAQIRACHSDAATRTRDLTNRHLEQVMVERSARRQAIARARRAMEGLPDRLAAVGEGFVRDSVAATRTELTGITSSETIHLDLDNSLDAYVRAVNELVIIPLNGALASTTPADQSRSFSSTSWTDGLVHPFDLSRLIFRMDVEPVVDPASRVAVDLGDLLTRVVDGGRSGREAGAAIGGWIGKNVLGEDAEVETVERIERVAQEVLKTVHAETERYIAEVSRSLEDADVGYETWMPPSPEVEKAESAERELAAALQWTDGLILAVKAAGR
jgi:hypothetical protein